MDYHHLHHVLPVVSTVVLIVVTGYTNTAAAQVCAAPPSDGGFSHLCNPYEFDEAYYPGEQENALIAATFVTSEELGICQKSPYGEDTGITLWLTHYASCEGGVRDCRQCLHTAADSIRKHCPNRIGAQAASLECCVRYEQYGFCGNKG